MTREEAVGVVEKALKASSALTERERAIFIVAFLDAYLSLSSSGLHSAEAPTASRQAEATGSGPGSSPGRAETRAVERPRVAKPTAFWKVEDLMARINQETPERLAVPVERAGGGQATIHLERNVRVDVFAGQLDNVILSYRHPRIGDLEASMVFSVCDQEIDFKSAMEELSLKARQVFRDRSRLKRPALPAAPERLEEIGEAASRIVNAD